MSMPPRHPRAEQHNLEIHRNLERWNSKPALREIYRGFHQLIAQQLAPGIKGLIVELGSGIGNIKEVIPGCIRTDLFPNLWIERLENAYALSFRDTSVADLILFDVFHHLRYPGSALQEFRRVLRPHGRAILFEPCLSLLGLFVYGCLHPEKLGLKEKIEWFAPSGWSPEDVDYYAAQGNATRIFLRGDFRQNLEEWRVIKKMRLSAISYVASGGYSKAQLYPDAALPLMRRLDRICDAAPALFATRLLVVLEKKGKAN